MAAARVKPEVRAGEAELRVALTEAEVEAQVADRRRHRREGARERRWDRALWREPPERVGHAGVAHYDGRTVFCAARKRDADRAIALDDHARDVRRVAEHTAGSLGAAHRVVRAAQVVAGDRGVDGEARLARRQAVVPELPGKNGDELLVLRELAKDVVGRLPRVLQVRAAEQRPGEARHGRRQRAVDVEEPRRARRLADTRHVRLDGAALAGEILDHLVHEAPRAGDVVVGFVAEDDAIVDIGERRPLERAVGQLVEDAADDAALADLTDVVDADVPLVAGARERVGVAADAVVPLEHQDAAIPVPREAGRAGEAADARADHDGIERARLRRRRMLLEGDARMHAPG